jgi:hypothetical protein
MQILDCRRAARAFMLSFGLVLSACSSADNPYSKIEGPLIPARLHTATLVTDGPALLEQAQQAGYTVMPLPPNYQAAIHVQSLQWNVPEDVAGKVTILKAPGAGPNLRILVTSLPSVGPPATPPAAPAVVRAFYENVLGTEVPAWPEKIAREANVRVQVWTFMISDVLDARRKLRAHVIPTLTEPVGITTSYLGDEKSLTLRAPDGAIVELVQAVAQ